MEKLKDLVIGFITGYDYDKLKPWVNSLADSGFSGDKIMVVYNLKYEVVKQLEDRGFIVVGFQKDDTQESYVYRQNFNVVVSRFHHLWLVMKQLNTKYRYIITTDVADVIFQSNPSEWLEKNLGDKKLCVGCEGLKYKDEEWGIHNMWRSFGDVAANYMAETPIYNAGTIAGDAETLRDFAYAVYLACGGAPLQVPGGGGPDQAALNLLLSLEPYKSITKFNDHDDAWACQCGTMVDPNKIHKFRPNLLSPEPTFHGKFVCNSKGEPYVLVHQYNRVPEWNELIRNRYE